MEIGDLLDKNIYDFQKDFALIDFYSSNNNFSNRLELLLLKLQNIKAKIYQEKGHQKPHIHIDYGPIHHNASYSIENCRRICGDLDRK